MTLRMSLIHHLMKRFFRLLFGYLESMKNTICNILKKLYLMLKSMELLEMIQLMG